MKKEQFNIENKNLKNTYSHLVEIITTARKENELPDHLQISNCNNPDEIPNILQEQERFYITRKYEYERIQKLNNILPEVYFARVDLLNELGEIETYYISKNGLESIGTTDWRSSIGALIYNNTTSQFGDRKITMKRKFDLSHDQLFSIHDIYLDKDGNENITDSFLIKILNEKKNENRITDIIKSIQEEQNNIIRLPENFNTIVLGCAGSGKTMILLHRLSYLKFYSKLNFNKVKIITPSNSFKEVFKDLQRDLEIFDVEMLTITDYFKNKLSSLGIDVKDHKTLSEYGLNDNKLLNKIYSNEMQSMMFTLFKKDVEEVFKCFYNYVPRHENIFDINVTKKYLYIKDNSKYVLTNLQNEFNNKYKLLKEIFSKHKENCINILDKLILINDSLIDYDTIDNNDCISQDIIKLFKLFDETLDEKYLKYKYTNVYKIKENIEKFINEYNSKKILLENLYFKQNSFIVEKDKKISSLDVLYKKIINTLEELNKCKSEKTDLRMFNFIKKMKLNSKINELEKVYKIDNKNLNAINESINNLNESINSININIISVNEYLNDFQNKYQNSLTILNNINSVLELYESIKPINKLFEERKLLQENYKTISQIANIVKWFDEKIINDHINKLLEENSKRRIDNIHKYNFYYVYLLLLINTYIKPRYNSDSFICIDEFQDISKVEIDLIKEMNLEVTINLYGDINQRMLSKGFYKENDFWTDYHVFHLNNNYRNTNQITDYYNNELRKKDIPVGVNGPEVTRISMKALYELVDDNAVFICHSSMFKECKKLIKELKVYKVEQTKGLEFNTVYVLTTMMNENEKYISYSRALYKLVNVDE